MTTPPPTDGRRRDRIVGAVVVLLGVGVLVLSVVALVDAVDRRTGSSSAGAVTLPSASRSTTRSATPTGSATASGRATASTSRSASGSATAARLPVVVLNDTRTTGLAQRAADAFRAGGWTVTDVGTTTADVATTTAYYDPSVTGAQAAAEALHRQFPAVGRTKERFAGLPAGPVVVVLTADYTAS